MFKSKNNNKNTNISKLPSESDYDDDNFMIDDISDIIGGEFYHNEMASMLPAILNSTIDITKLIIENRMRNSKEMSDEDIYQIHRNTFKHVTDIFTEK